ncbi:hypothetical protein FRC07_007906 [Ceratobasidium sp. 392]|nr:hypothetical protein FRC07_007906 [Ceratobasidium sp. 392]
MFSTLGSATGLPRIIEKIYEATLVVGNEERKFLAVIVQQSVQPQQQPIFPWSNWADHLGIAAWEYDELEPPEAVCASALNGVLALSDIEMTYGHYWITFAMVHTEPEDLANNVDTMD